MKKDADRLQWLNPYNACILALCFAIMADHMLFIEMYPITPFTTIDPTGHYFPSVLEVLEHGRGYYSDHPGCGYYLYLAFTMLPLKAYTLATGTDLVEYTYMHIGQILTYCWLMTALAYTAGLLLIAATLNRLTKTRWAGLFFSLAYFAISPESFMRMTLVTVEGFLPFITGGVIYLIGKHFENEKDTKSLCLGFLALGIGFGTKTSILPLFILTSLYLAAWRIRCKSGERRAAKWTAAYAGLIAAGFICTTFILGPRLMNFFSWMAKLIVNGGKLARGITVAEYADTLLQLLKAFSPTLLVCAAVIGYIIYMRHLKRPWDRRLSLAMMGYGSFIAYLLMAARSYSPHYMIVACLIVAFSTTLSVATFSGARTVQYLTVFAAIWLMSCADGNWSQSMASRHMLVERNNELTSLIASNNVDIQKDMVVEMILVQSRENFFVIGNQKSYHIFSQVLQRHQPNIYGLGYAFMFSPTGEKYYGKWDYLIFTTDYSPKKGNLIGKFMASHPSRIVAKKGPYILLMPMNRSAPRMPMPEPKARPY